MRTQEIPNVSYSLNSLKGVYIGIIQGCIMGAIKGDTRSLDYGSCVKCLQSFNALELMLDKELASVSTEKFSSIRDLKRHLQTICGMPRFRQRRALKGL